MSFFNPGRGYEKGQKELDKYYQQAQQYQQPYNQNGQNQYANLNDMIKNLMDPSALNNKWMESYNTSPQAIQAQQMANEHGANAASSMGLMGSNTALNATQAGTTQIGLNDRQNYLNDMMEKYKTAAGLSQGIYGQGANTAGQMGQNAMNMGQNSAEMQYGRENAGGNMISGLIGAGLGGIGSGIGTNLAGRWGTTGAKKPGGAV